LHIFTAAALAPGALWQLTRLVLYHVAQQQKFSRLNPFDQEERSVFNMVRATAAS
jgi:hypothetical protein